MNAPQKHEYPVWLELETLETRLSQLEALLLNTHGAAFESFSGWDDPIKEAYLGHCSEFAGALRKQVADLIEQAQQESRDATLMKRLSAAQAEGGAA